MTSKALCGSIIVGIGLAVFLCQHKPVSKVGKFNRSPDTNLNAGFLYGAKMRKGYNKGKDNPNYGKHPSEETIRKMCIGRAKHTSYRSGYHHSEETRRKMRIARAKYSSHTLGLRRSDESKKRMSDAVLGDKHYNWQGGITPINHQLRKGVELRIWRKAVFERDNYTCTICLKHGVKLHAHHIKSFIKFSELRYELSNGLTLCHPCHVQTDNYGSKGGKL